VIIIRFLNRVNIFIEDRYLVKLTLRMSLISILITIVFLGLSGELSFINDGRFFTSTNDKSNAVMMFIITVILAPLLSTVIFQNGVISYLNDFDYFKRRIPMTIIVSAFIYSLLQYQNLYLAIYSFLMGCVFSYSYCISKKEKGPAYFVAVSIHMIRNTILFAVGIIR